MDRPLYQHIVFALLMSTAALYASDVSNPCKIVGLLDDLDQHQAEEHHRALHKQKEEIKGYFSSDLNSFTHRLDLLVEVAVLTAAASPLEIFARSMQHTQPGDPECAWCSAQETFSYKCKRVQEGYREQILKEIRQKCNGIEDEFNEKYRQVEKKVPEGDVNQVKQELHEEFQKRVAQEA